MNVYEDTLPRSRMESECVKTEDVYQTLHQPPSVKNPNPPHEPVRSFRIKTKLMVFNTLLLIIILIGVFLAKDFKSAEVNELKASGEDSETEELWRLHHGVFYLFWEAEGNCTEALKFCEDRNSEIAAMQKHSNLGYGCCSFIHHPAKPDQNWILSQANGRKLWMNIVGVATGHLNETLHQCPMDKVNPGNTEGMQGWICEISHQVCGHCLA
ncbi:hypothetical protein MHYP_G00284530 [Metynnis hypsauchen]